MDIKTLEYMGGRVDKARGLQKRITELDTVIKHLKEGEMRSIVFNFDSHFQNFNTNNKTIMQDAKPDILKAFENYQNSLQHELDEL